ncbi:hypothetical protein L6452_00998 [Arctium lappa]|uniref:Uncharacterized protein n=1 Tax=Arctium lappa TaxID=4217 RepID=A0ACB9FEX6_ARCLA|nr:hypothetical protein L6452_00998 [Arctium lappa]
MAESKQTPHLLFKQRSWSPDIHRDKEWQKLKLKQLRRYRHHRSKSIDADVVDVTDDDVKELKACFDLGFGFDPSNDLDPKLAQAFPALELYAAVNRQYNNRLLSRSSSSLSSDSSSSSSSLTTAIIDPSDDPQKVKTKLKHWAQVVSCSILDASSQSITKIAE